MDKVQAISAISRADRRQLQKLAPHKRIEICPAGAEVPPLEYSPRESNKIIAISNWDWKPNKDGLFWFLDHVYPKLVKKFPTIYLQIIGAGLNKTTINKYPNTNYLGFVDDLAFYRQTATLSVVPLFSGSGMKLKVIEGLANGLPIVTTEEGIRGIEAKDGIHYLHAHTKLDFFNQTKHLLENQTLRENISKNARNLVISNYQWNDIVQNYVRFLKKI